MTIVSALGTGIAATSAGTGIASAQSTTESGPGVSFANQTTNGSTVTIQNATLPEGGFIAIHSSEYLGNGPSDLTVIATSGYLDPGQYQNVTINISNAPPGNYPGVNRTSLNTTQTLVAGLYSDSNSNRRFDFVESGGTEDGAIEVDGVAVTDSARATTPTPDQQHASAVFQDQTVQNNTLSVSQATLPEGGFLTVHNQSYQQTGDPLTSTIGLSGYLSPGNHSNVTVRVLPGSLDRPQTVTLRVTMDTNNNQQYDYVTSGGFNDTGYSGANQSGIVTETAQVQVPSQASSSIQTQATSTDTGGFSQVPATSEGTVAQPDTPEPTAASGSDNSGGSGGSLIGGSLIWKVIGGVILVVVMILLIRILR